MKYKALADRLGTLINDEAFYDAVDEAAAILRRLEAVQGGVDGVMQLATELDDYGVETPNKAKIRNALRTTVEALALGGWQPIETVPEHGELLLAHIQAGKIYWVEAGKRGQGVLKKLFFTLTGGSMPTPTHWMPLPPAPKESQS